MLKKISDLLFLGYSPLSALVQEMLVITLKLLIAGLWECIGHGESPVLDLAGGSS